MNIVIRTAKQFAADLMAAFVEGAGRARTPKPRHVQTGEVVVFHRAPPGTLLKNPNLRKPVRVVRIEKVGRSRYTGEKLRQLRAERGCGRPPIVVIQRAMARACQNEVYEIDADAWSGLEPNRRIA